MKIRAILGQFRSLFVNKPFSNVKSDNDEYWKHRNFVPTLNSFQKIRADFISNNIKENSSVLDIGCGPGHILLQLIKEKNISAVGLDNSPLSIGLLSDNGIKALLSDIDQESIDNLKNYDFVLMLEVLEHLPNPETILLSCLKKSDFVFISVPNTGYFIHRLRLLFGRFPIQWKVHPGEHLRFWTIRDMVFWLERLDVEVVESLFYEGIPFLNKIFPKIFSMGQIYKLKNKNA